MKKPPFHQRNQKDPEPPVHSSPNHKNPSSFSSQLTWIDCPDYFVHSIKIIDPTHLLVSAPYSQRSNNIYLFMVQLDFRSQKATTLNRHYLAFDDGMSFYELAGQYPNYIAFNVHSQWINYVEFRIGEEEEIEPDMDHGFVHHRSIVFEVGRVVASYFDGNAFTLLQRIDDGEERKFWLKTYSTGNKQLRFSMEIKPKRVRDWFLWRVNLVFVF
jgi:hypothetical protein